MNYKLFLNQFFHRIRFLRFTFSAVIVRCPHFDFFKKQVQFFH